MENEALQIELANQKRGAAAEEASLKERLTAAELQLEEVKREAEEYQKGSVLHNLETVALGNQVGTMYKAVPVNNFFNRSSESLDMLMGEMITVQCLCAGDCTETGHCEQERAYHT